MYTYTFRTHIRTELNLLRPEISSSSVFFFFFLVVLKLYELVEILLRVLLSKNICI